MTAGFEPLESTVEWEGKFIRAGSERSISGGPGSWNVTSTHSCGPAFVQFGGPASLWVSEPGVAHRCAT